MPPEYCIVIAVQKGTTAAVFCCVCEIVAFHQGIFAVQKSCIEVSAVAVFVEWWIVTVQELCYSLYNRWGLL